MGGWGGRCSPPKCAARTPPASLFRHPPDTARGGRGGSGRSRRALSRPAARRPAPAPSRAGPSEPRSAACRTPGVVSGETRFPGTGWGGPRGRGVPLAPPNRRFRCRRRRRKRKRRRKSSACPLIERRNNSAP